MPLFLPKPPLLIAMLNVNSQELVKKITFQLNIELDPSALELTLPQLYGRVVNSVLYNHERSFILDELDFSNGSFKARFVPNLEIEVKRSPDAVFVKVTSENKSIADTISESIIDELSRTIKRET